ncbi:tandem-95 repeat protein [Vibrio alginolyticus]|nr:tandem-95 repeat protein [Vibrio alginolyticus]
MDRTALVPLGNQVVVIGLDGQLRVLAEGQQPLPGEVIVAMTDAAPQDLKIQLAQEQGLKDISDDVAQIISAIEQGQDPSATDEELAPAAGENSGSSLQNSATIVRDGTEVLASTNFETIGLESLGLSETQALTLNDFFTTGIETSGDGSSKPLTNSPVTLSAVEEDSDPITITTEELLSNVNIDDADTLVITNVTIESGNGTLIDNSDGSWTYIPEADDDTEVSFSYDIIDNDGGVINGTANLDITPVNDAPIATNDAIQTDEDSQVVIDVLANDSDIEGDDLIITSASVPEEQGIVEIINGKLVFTPAENFNGNATISYTISDGELEDEAQVSVTVNSVNDAPIASNDTTITEEDSSVTIDVLPNDTDIDGDTLSIESASVPEAQGTVEIVDGKLVFTPAENFHGDAEITYTITDGALTDQATVNVTVNAVNDTPVVESNIADQTLAEDFTPYSIDLNTAFSDVDNVDGELTFSVSGNSNIQVAIVNGIATFTPTADWNGSEALTFTATDPSGESVSQTVNFTVAPVADIVADKATVVEDTPTIIKVLDNDTFEGDDKVVSLDTDNGPANGTVSVNPDGSVTYTPNDNFHGTDSFTYIVTSGGVSESTTVNVDVTPVNDAPVAKDDTATTQEDTAVTIDVLPNDTDIDGDTLSIQSASVPEAQGTVEIVDGKLVFTPAENFHGDAEITYTITDGALTDQATVNVTVNAVNDTPVVESNIADQTLAEDFTPYSIDLNTAFSDVDNVDGDLTFSVSGNSNIQVAIVNGIATFTPTADWNGSEALTFTATDPGGESVSQTVNFTVAPVADIVADSATVVEDTPTIIKVLGNDTFEGNDKVVSLDSNNGPANGTVSVNPDGSVTYTPNDNFHGTDSFTYIVTSGGVSESTTVNVDVTPVNDAPVATNDNAVTDEDTPVTIDVLPNDTDIDGDTLSIQSASVPEAQGTVEIVDGKLVFTPAENFHGDAEITYTVTDGSLTDQATVNVTVNAVNDTPVVESNIADQTLAEDFTPYSIDLNTAFSDVDNVDGELTFSVSGNSNIQVAIVNGIATFTPTADWNGSEALTFTATDPSGESVRQTVNFTVAPVADIVADKATVVEDTPTIIKVLDNDTFEGDDKVVSLDTNNGPANGTVSVNPDGSVTYTPNDNFHGTDSFTYIVTSGGVSESTTVNVDVTPVNDAPVATNDNAVTDEDTPVTIDVLPNDTDIDGDTLSIQSASVPEAQGTVEIVDGKLVFTPAENFHGDAEITYTITDGALTDQATVNVTVNAVNDTPVVESNIADQTLAEDFTPYSIDLNTAFSDVDNVDGELTFSVSGNSNIQVAIVNGIATFTPTADWNGSEALTFTATDPSGESVSQTVNFTVAPVADIESDRATVVEDTPTIIKVLGNDTFEGDDKVVSLDTNNGPANGTVSVNPDGSVTYTPNDNYHGADSFTYIVTSGGVSESTTVNVDVTPVNDAPVAKDDTAVTDEDTPVTIDVLPNDTDIDGDKLSIDSASVPSEQGTVEIVDGKLVFTPAENFHGDAEITYTVTDGALTDQATVNVTVNAVNDTPVVESSIADQTLAEDFTPYSIDLNTAFSDVDNVDGELTFSVSGNSNIQVAIVNGIATFTPTADWNGSEALTFTATDLSGESVSQTVNFTVAPVADIVADKATVVEDTPTIIKVLENDTFEGDDKVVSLDTNNGPANGTVSVNPDGSVTYKPNDNYHGTDSFTYIVTSGGVSESTTVNVDVTPVNDAPVATNDTATTQEDTAVTIDVLPNDTDIDGDTLRIDSASVPSDQGSVEIIDGKLVFTPAENFHGDAEITYTITDGALTDQATVNVTVNAVNDTPVVESSIAGQTLAEDFTPYSIDLNTAFSDVDNVDGELSFSVSGNSNIQVAIVNGIATFTPTADWNGSEALTFTATDPSGESVSQTVNFIVAPVADIVADKATVVEDTPTIIKVLENDTFEGDDKVVSLDTNHGPANGTVSVNPDGSVTYTPNDNYHGADSFTYIVTSGGVSESTTVNVDVTPVNDAPVANDDAATTQEDTAVTIDVLPNDTDIDGDTLRIDSASVPSDQGTVEIVDGKLVFTPAENFHGDAEITYTVTDGSLTDQATVNVTVNAVNDTPVVESNIADQTLAEDFTPYSIDLNTAFSDVDNVDGELSFSVSGNSNVLVSIENGIATISPTADWNGSEILTFTATDPSGESVSQTVNFTVAPVADIVADNATVVEDTPTIIKVLGNDTFEGDDKVVSIDTNNGPANGTVSVNPDGSVTYTPNDNYHGTDSFTYIVTSGGVSESTTVNVDVTPVNDAPVATNDNAVTDEDTPVTIDVLPNDTDIDGDTLSIQSASVPSEQGTVEIVDGKLVFTPAENFHGDAEITYTITDGALTDQATVNVTVNAVNDTPVVESNIADQTLAEDFTPYSIDLNTAFSDVDNADGELTFSVSGNSNIQVAIVNGIATFTPTADWNGSETLTFTATDPSGESVSQTVNFTVAPVADIVADKATVVEDTPTIIKVLGNDTFEGNDKVVSLDSNNGPANGTVSVNPDGSVTYTPNDNYHGADSFTYIVTSGGVSESTTVNVDVTPVNDAPVATNDNAVTDEDTPVTIDVLPNDTDIDGDTLSIQSASVPSDQGKVEIIDGKLVFTPAENFHGDAEITYTVTDGALTDQATVNVTVNAVNDTPVVESNLADQTLAEDFTPYSIDLNTAFSDVDNVDGELSFSGSGNSNIQVAIVNGIATFTPTADWNGSEALTFTATDPSGESVSQTVNFTVAPVADIVADNATVVEDTPTIIKVLDNDTFEGDDKVVSLDTNNGPANGTVSVNPDGSVTYTPNDNYYGTDSFTYIVTSGGVSESTTVNVDVTPVNDAPVANDDIAVTDEDTPVTIDVLPNDTDIDGDTLSIQSASVPSDQGTVEIVDGKLVFTPAENFHGDAEITYTVTDGALTDQATVNVTVNAVNDTPVVESNIADQTLAEDFTPYSIDLNTAFSDVDNVDGDLTFSVSGNSNIQVAIVNGIATFTPTADWNGSEALTFTVTDPSGESVSQTVNFTVAPVADIVADKATVMEDTPTIIKVLGNDTFEGDDKVVSLDTNNGPANGTVSVNPDGSVTYTPNDNYHGTDSFTYIVTSGGVSESTTVNVDVTPVNDAPVAKDDTAITDEDTPVTIDVLPNDTDIDGDKLSIESASVPEAQGTVEIVDGKLVFTPAENFHGDAEITYTVTDGSLTDQATVNVTVNAVNDTPVVESSLADQTLAEDFTPYSIDLNTAFSDVDNADGELTFSVSGNSNIQVAIVNGIATITPTADWNGSEALTFTATDPSGESVSQTVNFTVAPVADIVADNATVVEDTPTIIKVLENDTFEGDDKVVSLDTNNGPANGTVSVNPDGSVTYTPNDNYHGTDSFTYIVTSGGVSESTTVNVDVTPVNDAPVAKDDTAVTDEDTPVTIDVLPNDTDIDGDTLSIQSASVPSDQGTVEIVDGKLVFTPAENFHGDAEITYTVTDGALTDQAKVAVTVNPVNDAPTIKVDAVESITEDAVSTDTVVATLEVADTDTPEEQLTVSLENNSNGYFALVGDEVKLTQAGVDAVNNDELNLKDLTISASVSDGVNPTVSDSDSLIVNRVNDAPTVDNVISDQVLAEDFTIYTIDLNDAFKDSDSALNFSVSGNSNVLVSIENGIATISPTADWNGSEALTFTATDPSGESVSQTVNFTVAPVADIVADKATVVEDTPTIIKVLGNDTFEGDDKVVSIDINNGPANGTVSVNPDGSVTYTPNDNYHGTDSFTYIVTSGGVSESTTVNVDVTPVNDAPVATNDTAITDEDTPVTIDVLPNDTDIDGDTLSIQSASVPSDQGTVEIVDGKLVFTPAENFHGDAEITYTVTDGSLTDQATVNVTVNAVNDTPVVESNIADQTLAEDFTPYSIDLNTAFSDVDNVDGELSFSVSGNNNVLVSIENGIATISPTADWNGSEALAFTATDPSGESVSQTVNFTVAPVADIVADNATVVEDTPTIIKVLGNDTFEGDDKVVSLDTNNGPANGTVSVNLDGSVTYTPNDNYHGTDSFTYIVTSGGVSESTTVNVDVTPVNDAPVATNDNAVTDEDTPVTIDVLPNDTDIDGDELSIQSASVPSDQGTVEIVDGKLVFTPAENFHGDAEITYTITDGALTDQATVNVTVNAVNDAPVVESSIADQALAEDFTPYSIDLNTAFSDVDNVDGELSFSVSGNSNIQVAIVNGIATFTPTADWNGSEALTFTATDPSGESVSQTVNFTVAPVADIVTDKATVVEDTPTIIKVLGNDTFEGDDKVVSLDTNNGPANGTVSVNLDGSVTYTPNDNYHGTDSFTYIVTSGGVSESTTVNVDVTPVNDAPVATNDNAVTDEDTPVTIDVLPNDTDIDGDTLSIQSASVPETQGTVEIVDGKLVFTPAENFHGDAEITYTVTDGALTDQATVNVTVNAVNDTPVVESNLADQTLAEDFTPYTIDLNTAFSDVDNVDGELTFSVSGNSNVLVSIENGIATISPTADWNGSEALTFTATDPSGESVSQTVNFTVAPVADIVADNATVVEDTPTIIKVLGNDTFEGNDKVVSLDSNNGPANGTVSVNPDGSVTYTPNDNYHGTDSFTYIVTSGGVSESTTVNVDVTPVNDAPVANDDTAITDEDTPVTIDVLPNDTDIDGDKLSIQSASVPSDQGTVEIVDGKLVFTPAENFHGDAEITYTVTDGALTDQATVNVTVNAVNDTPVVESSIADQTLAEDFTPYTIDLNTAFSDVDNADGELTFSVSGNSNIQVAVVNGIATFTPTADWNGSEALTFTATDPSGESVSQTVNFTVTPVADIVADKATVVEDTPTIIKVLDNDTFEGDDKVVSLDTNNGPANGTVSVNPDGSVTYTPNDNYHGTDSFTYIVTSGGVSESTTVNVDVTPVNDKPDSEDFTHVTDKPVTQVVFDTDTKPLGDGDSQDHIADVEDDLKGNDLHVRITELPTSGTLFFKDSDGELHEIKEVSDTLYDKDSLYYEADNVGFLLGIKDRPNTPNGSESTTDFNNWGLSEDGGSSHSRTEHLANGASITISSDSGELAQYNRQVSHIGNGIADNDGQGIEKGETITIDLSNNPVGSVNLGLDGLGGLFDYGDDNAALITVTYLDSNNVQQTQTFEFLKPEGNFMLFQETSVGYGKDLALPEGSVITQLDFSTKNEGNWELRYVEGVPAEDSFGYVAVDSENGVSDPSTVNIVNEMLDGNIAENGPSLSVVGDSVTEGDNVTFSVVLNETTSTAVKYQVDMLAQGSSVDKNDVNLSNATYTNGVVFLGGYLIVPAGISSFEISIPTIDDLVVESSETIVLEIGGETGTATVLDNDSTKLSVVDAGDVIEGTDAIFTVLLSNPVQEAVVVNLKSTTNDSYTAEDVDLGTMVVTYVDTHGQTQTLDMAPNGDVTIPPGVAEIKVAVPTKLDNVHEGDESFGLTVTEIGSVTSNGIATGNANIVDSDPAPLVSISADQNSVNEGETAGFTLTLDKVADESVTVHVEYSGVAQDGKDFVGVLSVEVPAGQSSAALDLLTVTDGIYEGTESFTVTIKEVDGADASIASNNSASVVIVDAQSAPKVTISSDQSSVDEGSDAKFIVNIDQKADEDVLVTFTIGGNVDDKDYIAPSTYTVTIPAGKTSAPIDIKTLDDGIYEDLENLTVTLIDTVGADSTLASDSNEATVSIIDAQHAPEFISGGDSAGDKPNDDVYDFGSVNENTVSGAVIGTVVAEDHDNDVLVYRFADGSSTNGIFDIDPTSGEISLNKTIDDVDLGDYTLQVEVIDGTGGIDTAEVNVSLVNVNDAPESSPSVVEMNEDTQVMLDWSSFGISDVDSDVSDLSVQITTLPSDGSLEYRDSQGDWQSVQIDQVLDKSLFEENGVRFVPELNESGSDSFGGNQVGDQESSYAQIGFKPTDGQSSGQESTLTIDVNPVADKPNLIAVTPLNSLPQQEFNVTTWSNVQVGSSDGMGVNGETLISAINALNEADGTRLSWANVEDLGTHATLANEAVLVTSLVYLEAGSSYDFVGQADDSLAIKLGGTLLDQARWGSDSGDIKGASFTPSVSGFYPIEIYHHNQSGPGNFNVDVSINGQAPVNLSNSSLYVVSDESALEATDIRTSELQEVNGVAFYETYQLNEGLQDTAIPLSEIKASLNDTDGSESLKVTLTGLPVGAILSDGNSSITVATIDEELDVTSWALDALTVTPPAGSHDDFTINLTATSTESSNGDSAESNLAINVVVHENLPTETESDLGETIEDNTLQGNVLLNDSDGDNILMVDHLTIDGADYEVGESVSLTSGTLLVNRDGSYIFEPAEHWSGDVPLISYTTNTGVTNTLDINVVAIADAPTITINVGDLVKRDAIDPNHHLATSAINNTNTENEAVAANLGLDNAVPKINTHAGVVLGVNTDLSDTDSLFVGTDFNDVFYGGGGDDVFVGGGNNDTFYGDDATSLTLHDGKDTVYLTGNFDDYKMTFKDDHGGKVPYWILLDSRSIDSVNDHTGSDDRGDHLYEIERVVFADKIVDLKPDGTYEVLQDRWISVDVDVDLVDVDGSEDLAQTALVQDLPDGVDVYVDGVAIKQDSNGDYPVTLGTDGKLSLDIRVPFDYEGSLEFPLSVTATSVEGSNNDAASTTESVELTARDYVLESGSHGNDQITGSDDHDIIVGDVQGLEIIAGQDYNIAFVLDTSGSMGNWVGTAKQEVLDVFDELLSAVNQGEKPGTVNIHLSEFASSASAVISVDLSSLTARKEFVEELNRVIDDEGSGGTNYEAGLQSAVEWFSSQPNPNGQNITYFVTDGQPNRATYLYGVAPSEFSKVILDVDNSGKLVTLQDIASKNNYSYGQTVTYKGDVVIDSYGKVYSPLTGRILGDIDRYYGSIRYYDEGNSSTQAQHMYQVLAALSSIEAIGLGSGVDEHTLKQYDTDGVVESDIDVTKLAETILGQDVPLKQGSDTIQGGEGNDILLGDLIEFGGNEQGLSAIQSHVAQQTGQDVSTVDGEDIHEYVRNNLEEFNQTHQGDKSDNLYGGAGDDLLFGHGGNDILVGGEGDDILIGGLGSDTLTGSEGADIFKWSEVTNDVDTVTDFNKNEDALDFSDLFDDLSKDEIGELLNDLQSGDHTGDVGEYHVEVAPDGGSEANLSITKGSSTLDIHFDGASVDDVTQSLIASLEAQYKDM